MSFRTWSQAAIHLCALMLVHAAAIAQQEPLTADQVVSKYMEAIGASRYTTITTFVESGELDGNLTNFWQGNRSPWQSHNTQHGTFESYFKSPNLRFNSAVTDDNQLVSLRGCDGKTAWYVDPFLKRTEYKAKSEGECEEGFKGSLWWLREPNSKMRLVKQKEIDGRMAWEIKVQFPKSPDPGTYYFDAETFLLLRFERRGNRVSYSDYRDIGGIKFPFKTIQEFTNSKLVTTLREVNINAPIDDSKFAEPQIIRGQIVWNTAAPKKNNGELSSTVPAPQPATSDGISKIPPASEASKTSPPELTGTHGASVVAEVNFPNYTSCTMAELESVVPEIKGLKMSVDQELLSSLLDRVGMATLDIARNTPNLIARERVSEPLDRREGPHDYDYLILARPEGNTVTLDEFRLDLKSGAKFETGESIRRPFQGSDSEHAVNELANSKSDGPPMSQGFATSWVHFYPSNRVRASYRYLGEERVGGHRMLVLAFAQKPGLVPMPASFQYQGKTTPIFLQGIAWIDPSDFRILRLRTDLLSPVPEVSLHRFTADIQFGPTRIEQLPSPLQLPHKVTVTTAIGGSFRQEIHEYSGYRLFRARSRVVALP